MNNIHLVEVPHAENDRVVSAVLAPTGGYIGTTLAGIGGWVSNPKTNDYVLLRTYERITSIDFRSRDNKHRTTEVAYVTGENCSGIQRFDVDLGIHYRSLFLARAQCVAYSQDGALLVAGSTDGKICAYALQGDKYGDPVEVRFSRVSKKGIASIAVAAKGILFATLVGGGTLQLNLLDPKSKPQPAMGSADWDKEYHCLAVDSEGMHVAFAGLDSEVTVYNCNSRMVHKVQTELGNYIRSMSFLPNNLLAIVGANGLELWNTETYKRCYQQLHAEGQKFYAVHHYGQEIHVACAGCRKPLGVS
jgi:WD40 repeat protein